MRDYQRFFTKPFIIIIILFIGVFSCECESCDSLLVQRKQFIVQHQCVWSQHQSLSTSEGNIRIKTPTAVCWTIPSATRLNIWTSLNSVTHVQVRQCWYVNIYWADLSSVVDQTDSLTLMSLFYSPSAPPVSGSLIVLISAAAAAGGFLLIVTAVGIFCIYRKCKNSGQEIKKCMQMSKYLSSINHQFWCKIENFVLTCMWCMQFRPRRKTKLIQHCLNQQHEKW